MIPIACPRCGRSGSVPPDRLNARFMCKGCHSAFHMDNGGRMVLGEPNTPGSAKSRASAPAVDFDLAQTWRDVPKPAKFGVPAVFVLLAGWMMCPDFSSGMPYVDQAEAIGRALVNGDRARVVALAPPASAEAAGKWYDLMRPTIASQGSVSPNSVQASLFNGNPDNSTSVSMGVIAAATGLPHVSRRRYTCESRRELSKNSRIAASSPCSARAFA